MGDTHEYEWVREIVAGLGADYADVRVEERSVTRITFRSERLEQASPTTVRGACVRALVRGGWGCVTVEDLSPRSVASAARDALTAARMVGTGRSVLAPVQPRQDVVRPALGGDPAAVPMSEKRQLLQEYNDILLRSDPKVKSSVVRYVETVSRCWFASSEGAWIDQRKVDVGASMTAIARDDGNVCQSSHWAGGSTGYSTMLNQHEGVRDAVRKAREMLGAKPIKGGRYTVVIDPRLAGTFAHEAFGHLSESDFVYENERLREIMQLGRRFGPDFLNIGDGAGMPGRRASFAYDDEGTPTRVTWLIKNGVLSGRLHSRETAARMGEEPTGNARAVSYRFSPIVRMTNTFIDRGTTPFKDMIADIKEGVYVANSFGGETAMEMFTFSAGEAFMIRNGQIAERVRDASLSGNVFETLNNIECVGDDLTWFEGGVGGCGKGDQWPLPIATGSPHIRVRNLLVGGPG